MAGADVLVLAQVSERPNEDATPYKTKYEARELLVRRRTPVPHLRAHVRVWVRYHVALCF
eukprot:COSAG02_NODE_5169_length_4575_cov_2.130920_2_plen_60_part_00